MTQEKFLLVTQPEIPGPQKYLKVSHFPLFFQKKKKQSLLFSTQSRGNPVLPCCVLPGLK